MLRTITEIMGQVLVRNNVTTSATGLYTDANLKSWLTTSHRWATSRHKTPLTEGRISTTYTGVEETPYPEGWKSDSIRYLEIGGESYDKTLFQDYKHYRQRETSGSDRMFTDYGRTIHINPNAGGGGTLMVYGQYTPYIDVTDEDALTVYSDADVEGNDAIVEEMLSQAAKRERKLDESTYHHLEAVRIMDELYGRIGGEQFGYKPKDSEMFKRIDVLAGDNHADTLKRDQFC